MFSDITFMRPVTRDNFRHLSPNDKSRVVLLAKRGAWQQLLLVALACVLAFCAMGAATGRVTFAQRVERHIQADTTRSFIAPRHSGDRAQFLRDKVVQLQGNVCDIDAAVNRGIRPECAMEAVTDTAAICAMMIDILERGQR